LAIACLVLTTAFDWRTCWICRDVRCDFFPQVRDDAVENDAVEIVRGVVAWMARRDCALLKHESQTYMDLRGDTANVREAMIAACQVRYDVVKL
jgi:hypothetical protein